MTEPGRTCRVCEWWAMGPVAAKIADERGDDALYEIRSPSGLRHLTEGSGYTACGRNCAPWEKRP